jgi:ribosomal protein L19
MEAAAASIGKAPSSAAAAAAASAPTLKEGVEVARTTRMKHKIPQKRASKLLNELEREEFEKLRNNRDFSHVRPGDSVLVERLPFMSSNEPDKIKGLVIAKVNRNSDSALTLLNSENGTPIKRRILMYSPLVQNITVVQKAALHKGKKRVRRSKLYYLEDRNIDSFTVN